MTDYPKNNALAALIKIVADESSPLSTTMRRSVLRRLRELEGLRRVLWEITGRDDWQRMSVDECRSYRTNRDNQST